MTVKAWMRVILCKGTFAEGINNIKPWLEREKLEALQMSWQDSRVGHNETEKHCHGGKRCGSTAWFQL